MDNSFIGIIAFFASFVISRLISERAIRELDDKQRGRLLGGFSGYRVYSLVGIVAIVGLYFVINALYPGNRYTATPVFVGALVLFLLVGNIIVFRKLKQLAMPDTYINKYLIGTFVQFIGLFALFAFLPGSAS